MSTKNYTLTIRKAFIAILLIATTLNNAYAKQVTKHFVVDMYGHFLKFSLEGDFYDQRENYFKDIDLIKQTQELISNKETDSLIKQMNDQATLLQMDDIAYFLMLNKVTNYLYNNSTDDQKNIFKYVILYKKGFDVFIGYNAAKITLYGSTNFMIDNCLFIEKGTKKYFDLSFNQGTKPSSEKLFELPSLGNLSPLALDMINPPKFDAKKSKKIMPFEYDGFMYSFTTIINQSLVEYYRELPPINISTVYLNYGLSKTATESLVKEMKKATSTMRAGQGVNFILAFVQQSFEYKNDEMVYGQEKFSFPEETIANAFSDCEDKSMLYAVLINKVLGLKTVALYYKDAEHINVAVESWNKKVKGNFTFNNLDYVVCEPTGLGFSVGNSPTKMQFASLIDW